MQNENQALVCLGLPLYENHKYLPEALESITKQTYRHFKIVAIDDASTDGTHQLMQEYASQDKRIIYEQNKCRNGLISNWRRVFFKSYELFRPKYFAWVSDHDVWHRDWLEMHIDVLEKHRDTVLVYPKTQHISENGEFLEEDTQSQPLQTNSMSELDRIYQVCTKMSGAGDKVYGLFRTKSLLRAGVFRYFTLPDRLLLIELGLYGEFRQIDNFLFKRRIFVKEQDVQETVKKQNVSLFGEKMPPLHSNFPHISHSIGLALNVCLPLFNDNFWKGLLASLLIWEKNRKDFIKDELKIINQSLINIFSRSDNEIEIIDNLSIKLVSILKSIPLINKEFIADEEFETQIQNLVIFFVLLYHYINSRSVKDENIEQGNALESLRLKNIKLVQKLQNAKKEIDNFKNLHKKMMAKLDNFRKIEEDLNKKLENIQKKMEIKLSNSRIARENLKKQILDTEKKLFDARQTIKNMKNQ